MSSRHSHHDDHHGHDHAKAQGHGHGHDHAHHHAPANFDRAFAIGISANIAFVAIEAFFGWRVNSLALLADAGHNLGDVAGLVLAWGAAFAGRLRPGARYTYGWKRASILAAFANAVLLLVAMGSLAWEAIGRLHAPEPMQGITVMVVAGIGIAVNLGTALLFMRGRENDINIQGAFIHMAGDALVSLGVVVAGGLSLWFGWAWLDPVTSLAIAAVIVIGTWGLLRESMHLALNAVPPHIDLSAVAGYLRELPGVTDIHDLHIWGMSTTESALTVHLVMPNGYPGDGVIDNITQVLTQRFSVHHSTLQIEQGTTQHACSLHTG